MNKIQPETFDDELLYWICPILDSEEKGVPALTQTPTIGLTELAKKGEKIHRLVPTLE